MVDSHSVGLWPHIKVHQNGIYSLSFVIKLTEFENSDIVSYEQ